METLDIREVINEKLIVTDLESKTKKEVIEDLSAILAEQGYLDNKEEFINDVMLREDEGVTGLGNGIAIPHGKSEGVKITTVAVGKLKKAIEWESLDEELVSVIILFAVKRTDETTTHIKLLQKVAILLADDDLLEDLKNVESTEEVYKILTSKE
ncbi:PTS sugar transporter subunit IIA [Enterococcus sp. LJL90]